MKSIDDVIAELIRAADDVAALSEGEKLRLVVRAYTTIREGQRAVDRPERLAETAEAIDVAQAGETPLPLHDDELRAILLEAVKTIREIKALAEAERAAMPDPEAT